jgi:hypothetical protein
VELLFRVYRLADKRTAPTTAMIMRIIGMPIRIHQNQPMYTRILPKYSLLCSKASINIVKRNSCSSLDCGVMGGVG